MADLKEFIAHFDKTGIARKSRYRITITGPKSFWNIQTGIWASDLGGILAPEELSMMCESISFPGQNIRSVPDTLRFGPAREHGQGVTFGPFNAQFICSSDLREKAFFERWQAAIINLDSWEVNYYDAYRGGLEIIQLDPQNNPTYAIRVHEAYPKTIMPQDVGYAQNNAYQTIGVEFTYRFWKPFSKEELALLQSEQTMATEEFDAGVNEIEGEMDADAG